MAPPLVGVNMAVDGVNTLRQWRIVDRSELRPYAASNTKSGYGRNCGIVDWEGVYLGYGILPAVFPGETFTFTGSLDGSHGYTGSAYCNRVEIIVDIENGNYVEYAVGFACNGILTPSKALVASDVSIPSPPCPEGLTVSLDDGAQTHVRFMRLIMENKGAPYVDSETAGRRHRTRGIFDAKLQYSQYFEDPTAELADKDIDYNVKVGVGTSLSWDISFMRVESIQPIVDLSKDENVGAVIEMAFNASDGTSMGHVKTPEEIPVEKWPYAS